MSADVRRVPADGLRRTVDSILTGVGLSDPDRAHVTHGLVEADLRGVPTHGVMRLEPYVNSWLAGKLNAHPSPAVRSTTSSVATMDGDGGLGIIVGRMAMDVAIDMARRTGVGVVAVRGSNHTGMLAQHVIPAAESGMIGYFVNNGPPVLAPPGGREAVLCNNPFAYAVPAHDEDDIVLDMACSEASRGMVRIAAQQGRPIPDGWAVDREGRPTTDPDAALEGALLPFAGHKGLGLAVINECLAAALSGALISSQISQAFLPRAPLTMDDWGAGHMAMAMDLAAFGDPVEIRRRVDVIIRSVRQAGADVRVPGSRAARARREHLATGVRITDHTYERLRQMCERLGAECHLGPS